MEIWQRLPLLTQMVMTQDHYKLGGQVTCLLLRATADPARIYEYPDMPG
jgi:hypothetical protein